ncbi:FecCD family ABC transporter permease [Microbacterium sp. Root61]|uniref:FecCD family ABC transporter permease n=1 Tax=Microbacterium sp. Root61 TaxID=1736570 RepID=UPI000B1E7132|nr:iron chelate uptake ABC transporter family permease subunit [Microbacterium sp. Root61]
MTARALWPVQPAIVPGRPGWAVGPGSGVLRPRYLLIGAFVCIALLIVLIVAVTTGTIGLSLDRVWAALTGVGDKVETLITGKRLTRALLAALVGFAFGAAGGITQSLTRNPLASPDILGVSAGAGVAAVAVITSPLVGVAASVAVPIAALIGGLAVTALIVGLSWRRGLDPLRLVLTGIGVTALAAALTEWMLLRAELEDAAVATRWLTGSIVGATWSDVAFVGIVCVTALVAIAALARPVATLRLGPEVARAIGTRTGPAQAALLLVAVALVSFATAVVGPIGFVAFVAPQVALRLFGTDGPPVFAAGLFGALLVSTADLSTRWLPVELPVGVITSLVGGPVLIALLFHYVRRTSA